jgi:hypothetical protein
VEGERRTRAVGARNSTSYEAALDHHTCDDEPRTVTVAAGEDVDGEDVAECEQTAHPRHAQAPERRWAAARG